MKLATLPAVPHAPGTKGALKALVPALLLAGVAAGAASAAAPPAAARPDSVPPAVSRSIPPAPGAPDFACVTAIEGLVDSLGARDFRLGFEGTFADLDLATERASVRPGEALLSVPISNRFRLLHGDNGSGAWQVQVSLQWTGAAAAKRGARPKPGSGGAAVTPADTSVEVVLFTLSPEAVAAGARVMPARERLTLDFPREPRAQFARKAGRAVALVVLERLHHLSEDLAADERLRIEGVRRSRPPAATDPAPRR